MTSPARFESTTDLEKLSPVKLPGKLTPLNNKQFISALLDDDSIKTPDLIIHPHGLTAKHAARRNTIHHQPYNRRKLVETPLTVNRSQVTNSSAVNKKVPLTSPRINNLKPISLEAFRKSKSNLDSKLSKAENPNKENTNPFESSSSPVKYLETPVRQNDSSINDLSSPMKRNNYDSHSVESARKIARVITNANEASDSVSHHNNHEHSIQVDEVFNKEDLVGRMNTEKSSPIKVMEEISQSKSNPSVIDNDSDSDPEDYGRIENTISQTIMPNTSVNDNNYTQLNKIIKVSENQDYITPQRYTEPIAKSPATNQQIRINEDLILNDIESNKSELKDVTSPLKDHRLSDKFDRISDDDLPNDNLENEPTINFLMSPNSKPVFSVDQIRKIQNDFTNEIKSLQNIISDKNREVLKINQELSTATNQLIINEQELKELKQMNKTLLTNEEVLSIQLKHNERELASLTKNYKIKENLVNHLELNLTKHKSKIENLVNQLNLKTEEYNSLNNEISGMQEQINNSEASKSTFELKIRNLKGEIAQRNEEISRLTNSNLDNNLKIESLLAEKEDLLKQLEELTHEKNDLKHKLEEERDLNLRQEELVKELDKLENLAKDKILTLENTIRNKDNELESRNEELATVHKDIESVKSQLEISESEKAQLLDACDKLEKENSRINKELSNSQAELSKFSEKLLNNDENKIELNNQISNLTSDLAKENNLIKKLNSKIDNLESENSSLLDKFKTYENEIHSLHVSNADKDSTIIEDTKRMNELVDAIEKQKSSYEAQISKVSEEIKSLKDKNNKSPALIEENEFLRKQIKSSEALLEKKISEVATFLHQEYAEKHIKKLREVKDKYEKEIGVVVLEKKTLQREIDSLKRKLTRANEECQRVNEFVHLNKLNYTPSNGVGALSPKRSNGGRGSRY